MQLTVWQDLSSSTIRNSRSIERRRTCLCVSVCRRGSNNASGQHSKAEILLHSSCNNNKKVHTHTWGGDKGYDANLISNMTGTVHTRCPASNTDEGPKRRVNASESFALKSPVPDPNRRVCDGVNYLIFIGKKGTSEPPRSEKAIILKTAFHFTAAQWNLRPNAQVCMVARFA